MANHTSSFAPGVGALFAAVALVPLLGLGWLAASDVNDATDQADRTVQIEEITARLDDSIQAEALVDAESYWGHASASASEFGIPPGILRQLTGLDLEAKYAGAQADVDRALAANRFPPEAIALLEEARALVEPETDNAVIEIAYDKVEAVITASIEDDLLRIRRLASGVQNPTELTDAVSILELAVELRATVSSMTESYFGARFGARFTAGGSPTEETMILLESQLRYRSDLEALRLLVPADSDLKTLWLDVDQDPAVVAFFERADGLTGGPVTSAAAPDFSAGILSADILAEADAFVGSLDAVGRHVEFVEAVSTDVVERSATVRSDAEASRNRALAFTLALVIAALVAVAAASVWIVRPLRRMASVVAQLREGKIGGGLQEAGPAEVRAAARALNEAVDNMAVAERMATALAERDLESPDLQVETTGRLGSSLRDAVSALAASMAEREEFRERLAHEASHDGLTGVANRSETMAHLNEALGRFRRTDGQLAVLFVDIDGFKLVNDLHGHAVGDQVLRTVAQRLQEATRLGDHVGRIGGDEFVVIAEPIDHLDAAQQLAERVLETVARPLSAAGMSFPMTVSIGLAFATPISTPEDLLRDADLALYEAKAEGRSRVNFCDDELKARQQTRVTTEKALERAIDAEELELHFQPIVDSLGGELASVEALLRWRQPSGEFAPPSEFIPVAERTDLILAVDRWVLRAIARQLQTWGDDPEVGELRASVNISARHLSVSSLVEEVLGPLRAHGVDPGRLTIEVTETALLDDLDQAAANLRSLRVEGVRVAIDDFGTGYASLAQLRRLPVDSLKIDRSFVAGLHRSDDRSLVQLTIDTGHLLGASITAEGVETEDQARELTAMGADLLQGFGLGRPMSAEHLGNWIRRQPLASTPV